MDILLGHLLGDYVFQNRWMAKEKLVNSTICMEHSLIYTICVVIMCRWLTPIEIAIVVLSHFFIDRFRLAKYWRKFVSNDEEIPWIILIDNTIHLLILYILKQF